MIVKTNKPFVKPDLSITLEPVVLGIYISISLAIHLILPTSCIRYTTISVIPSVRER
jgi:hypothetical protein